MSGGGAPECGGAVQPACVSVSSPTTLSSQTPSFDLLDFTASLLDGGGAVDIQAGDHPGGFRTNFDVPTAHAHGLLGVQNTDIRPVASIKRLVVDLPVGLIGNPQAAPACSLTDLAVDKGGLPGHGCAAATQVGTIQVIETPENGGIHILPIYNVVPEHGYPAEFGAYEPLLARPVLLYASVRPGRTMGCG